MAKLSRVCPHCAKHGDLDSAYCAHCGKSTSVNTPQENSPQKTAHNFDGLNFPIQLRKAALPILAGAAGLVVRAGWKLLQSKTARDVALSAANSVVQSRVQSQLFKDGSAIQQSTTTQPTAPQVKSSPVRRQGRTIRISSRWAVGDANGILRQGQSEHTIEIDDV